jgi:hypothetical protein
MCIKYRINLIPVEHITLLGYFCDDTSSLTTNLNSLKVVSLTNGQILTLCANRGAGSLPAFFTNWSDNTNFPVEFGSGVIIGALDTRDIALIYSVNGQAYFGQYNQTANTLSWTQYISSANFQAGCSTIASSITSNGVSTASNASPSTMANNISTLATNKYNSGYSAGQSASTLKRVDLGTSNSISCTGYSGWQNFTTNNFAFYISSYGSVYANASGTNTHAGSVSYSYNSSTGVFTKSITDGYSNDTIDGNNSTHKSYLTLGVILYYV